MSNKTGGQNDLFLFLKRQSVRAPNTSSITKSILSISDKKTDLRMFSYHQLVVITQMQQIENVCEEWEAFILSNDVHSQNVKNLLQLRLLKKHAVRAYCTRKVFEGRLDVVKRILEERKRLPQTTLRNVQKCLRDSERQLSSPMNGDLQICHYFASQAIDEERVGMDPPHVIPKMGNEVWVDNQN